jgi:predicted aldo/keto reductase-like oxidoreductase
MQRVTLGNTGIEVSYLAFGTGVSGWNYVSDLTRLGKKQAVHLLRFAYDHGINFIDSADQYGTHGVTAELIKQVGRENVVVTTKSVAKSASDMRKDLDRFRKELGTDRLDIVLLHCMTRRNWTETHAGQMDVLSEAKAKGIVRAVGCSCHDFGAFQTAARSKWVEVNLCRINYDGVHMDNTPDKIIEVLEQMHAQGKGVYGMKVVGQGRLTDDPRRAIQFVMGLSCVDAMTVGMLSEWEILQNIEIIEEFANVMV